MYMYTAGTFSLVVLSRIPFGPDSACRVTQQTSVLCHAADMSAVSSIRHVCGCDTQQTGLVPQTADKAAMPRGRMSAVSRSRNVCCATRQKRLPCHTADMSAV